MLQVVSQREDETPKHPQKQAKFKSGNDEESNQVECQVGSECLLIRRAQKRMSKSPSNLRLLFPKKTP